MGHFNQCSHLVNAETLEAARNIATDIKLNGEQLLDEMLHMQKTLQKRLAQDKPLCNKDPDEVKTCGEVLQWMRNQDDYIADETRELYTALGGMSRGEKDASSVWKPWKSDHLKLQAVNYDDLSPEDKLEVQFEMIDQVCFFLNKLMVLGFDTQSLFEMYYLKMGENFARQDNGY